jgi:hypothetical protein
VSADRITPSLAYSFFNVLVAIITADATTYLIAIAEGAFDLHLLD